jgi:phosphotransferase system  glucose/maltose/N-acetylglucosamine-specific IIC component
MNNYRSLDSAYGCFVFIALVLCFGPLLWMLPIGQGDKEGYAMLLGVPLMFAAFIAGIIGLVLSIVHRKEWPLGAMAAASVIFLLSWSLDEQVMMVAAVLYLAVLVSFCARWFFYRRRKMKQAGALEEKGTASTG